MLGKKTRSKRFAHGLTFAGLGGGSWQGSECGKCSQLSKCSCHASNLFLPALWRPHLPQQQDKKHKQDNPPQNLFWSNRRLPNHLKGNHHLASICNQRHQTLQDTNSKNYCLDLLILVAFRNGVFHGVGYSQRKYLVHFGFIFKKEPERRWGFPSQPTPTFIGIPRGVEALYLAHSSGTSAGAVLLWVCSSWSSINLATSEQPSGPAAG